MEELQAQLEQPGPDDEPEDEMQRLKFQGNLELYTTENLKRREAIKSRSEFLGVVNSFWDVIDMIKDDGGMLNQQTYLEMHFKLHKALIQDINEEEARSCAVADWKRDSKGCKSKQLLDKQPALAPPEPSDVAATAPNLPNIYRPNG